jgi:hypothetical protein
MAYKEDPNSSSLSAARPGRLSRRSEPTTLWFCDQFGIYGCPRLGILLLGLPRTLD